MTMIPSSIFWSATSFSIQGSERLPEIAKILAPVVRNALELLRHDDEVCLKCATVLVAVGVILEVFEIIHDLREKTESHHPATPKWKKWVGFAGWLMIVIGISGELVFESAVSTRSEELEGISNALLGDAELTSADATRQADSAASSAGRAQIAADKADTDAGEAKTRADSANSAALLAEGNANRISGELDVEIAREQAAEKQLEGEKVKRLTLAVSLHKRELFDQSGLIRTLSSWPPHRVILVYPNEEEPRQFAEQFAFVFSQLHWPFFGRPMSDDWEGFPGVAFSAGGGNFASVDAMAQSMNLSEAIREAFKDEHIEFAPNQFVQGSLKENSSTILIGIGPKPETELENALTELGMPSTTPLDSSGTRMSGNWTRIPLDPTFKPQNP